MSFLFSFRFPSETLQLRRAYRNDRLTEFPPQAEKALVGIRSVNGTDYLAAKMSYRKNLTCGVILKRPFFCGLGNALARLACPVHSLWPAIKARVPPGERLFVAVNRRNFNRRPKATLAILSVQQADRYISHAFRRGSAQEMDETGPPFQSSLRLEFGTQMPYAATSIWRPTSKETCG